MYAPGLRVVANYRLGAVDQARRRVRLDDRASGLDFDAERFRMAEFFHQAELGYFYGAPVDRSLQQEHGMEIYWRAQITKALELTHDFQVCFDRVGQPGPAFFGALRIRLVF